MINFDFEILSKESTLKEALIQKGLSSYVKGMKFTPKEWREFYSTLSVQDTKNFEQCKKGGEKK